MGDLGQAYTDKEIEKLTHKINGIYKEARKDINRKMKDFNEKYKVKEARYAQQVKDGKITQEQFDKWKKGQVFQGKQWQAKKQEIENVLHNSNVIASQAINSERVNVFGFNMNYASYSIEHGTGVNFGFSLYDRNTVINLIKNEPNLLPAYTPKRGLDNAWNSKQITRQITQGIIQGESLNQIADRLAKVTSSQDRNSMLTHARTLMTGAQNAGRLESYRQAEKLGIDMEKEWMATLDSHTRDSHADVDGERQPVEHKFSNDCMYPGDPGGPPAETYNCRCTMVSNVKKYPAKYQRRDNINGERVDNMSYRNWEKAKKSTSTKQSSAVDKYSQARKDAALWAKSPKEADDAFRASTREVWKDASDEEKFAAWDYTRDSDGFNMPLRGYEGSWNDKDFKGVGNVDLKLSGKENEIKELTDLLSRSTLKQDTWLQRGIATEKGAANFLQISESDLYSLGQDDLSKLLVGKEVKDAGFMSCGSSRGTGFSSETILNIYCPEGTQALYCEPFSRFGQGAGKKWDGISDQKSFGSECETLLQRGSSFKITKVEQTESGKLYIDLDLVDQRP